jgi:hypothetical protein
MNPEIFCQNNAEWVGFEFIYTPQEVVRYRDVVRFMDLYRSGIKLPPPECYIHPVRGDYVIMDGNHRARAFYDLLEGGYFYDYFYGNNALAVAVVNLRKSRRPDGLHSLIGIHEQRYI